MLLQALSLISGLLLMTGLILTTNFTVAKNLENQKLSYALQSTSERALNDAQTWARDSIALQASEGLSNEPIRAGSGSGQIGCVDTSCTWHFIEAWRITGRTADGKSGKLSSATNLEPAVLEGRLSLMVITSIYKNLEETSRPLARRSLLVTGRTLDLSPYFVVTAVSAGVSNTFAAGRAEGDTAGVGFRRAEAEVVAWPDVTEPGSYVDTIIKSQQNCGNSLSGSHQDPKLDIPPPADYPRLPRHAYVPTNESLVWIYEAPCVINFRPLDAPNKYVTSETGNYVDRGSKQAFWLNGNSSNASLAR